MSILTATSVSASTAGQRTRLTPTTASMPAHECGVRLALAVRHANRKFVHPGDLYQTHKLADASRFPSSNPGVLMTGRWR